MEGRTADDHALATANSFFRGFDCNDPANPVGINPLEPNPYETTEEQVDDLLKVAERLFGTLDEMRRLRNVLQSSMTLTVELNRLAEQIPKTARTPLLGPVST